MGFQPGAQGEEGVFLGHCGIVLPCLPATGVGGIIHTCIGNHCLCSVEITLEVMLGAGAASVQEVFCERGNVELNARRKLASLVIGKDDQGPWGKVLKEQEEMSTRTLAHPGRWSVPSTGADSMTHCCNTRLHRRWPVIGLCKWAAILVTHACNLGGVIREHCNFLLFEWGKGLEGQHMEQQGCHLKVRVSY